MNLASYLIQVNIYLSLFYLFYALILKKETFFVLNRIYLISTTIVSLLIPLLQIQWIKELPTTQRVQATAQRIVINAEPIILTQTTEQSRLTFTDYLTFIYIAGVIVFSIRLLIQIRSAIFSNTEEKAAWSFFKKIVVAEDLPARDTILEHEKVHARQLHSADCLFLELITIVCWFNPIVHLLKTAIKHIHEFIADEISSKDNKAEYAILLMSETMGIKPNQLANSFFNQSLLKQRIIMLSKTKSKKVAILKYGLSAPLFVGMLIASSGFISAHEIITSKPIRLLLSNHPLEDSKDPALVEVDASDKMTRSIRNAILSPSLVKEKSIDTTRKLFNIKASSFNKLGFEAFKRAVQKAMEVPTDISGRSIFAITVSKEKKLTSVSIYQSNGSKWEQKVLESLKSFNDTIGLPENTYTFHIIKHKMEDLPGYKPEEIKGSPNMLFGIEAGLQTSIITKQDSSSNGQPVINTYIHAHGLKKPLLIVDGKEVAYEDAAEYIKLKDGLYPRNADYKPLSPLKAIEQYGDKAKNGAIIVTTRN